MKRLSLVFGLLFAGVGSVFVGASAGGCTSEDPNVLIAEATSGATGSGSGSGSGSSGSSSSSGGESSSSGGSGSSGSSSSGSSGSSGSSSSSSSSGAPKPPADPNLDGPYPIAEFDTTYKVPATGSSMPIHCAYPTGGPSAGPYPVVVVAHGFQLAANLYTSYVKRLATFGYVALTADFPVSLFSPDNTANAKELVGALDWAAQEPKLAGKADVNNAGMTGHSLGGKLAFLATSMDPRVKASITLDPVDGGGGFGGCNPPTCVDVSALMQNLTIPTAVLGETLDSTAGGFGQACAPAAENYATFYAGAKSPSIEVTINGAAHMSFLDNPNCGFACNACKTETAPAGSVNALSRAYVVAFYERYLRGDAAYDTYLTGAEAKARYIDTGAITLKSK